MNAPHRPSQLPDAGPPGADLRPRKPQRLGIGAMLAIGVHVLLIVAFTINLNWRSEKPSAVSAELWSAVPQTAAPAPAEPPPAPPAPPPAPEPAPAPPPPPPPVPLQRDADIALEKKQREAERERREEALREKVEQQRKLAEKKAADKKEADKKAADKREAERLAKEKADKAEKAEQQAKEAQRRKDEERLAKLADQARQDQLRRMQSQLGGVAGATGPANATGTAQRDAGPSASYAGRVVAKVKPNIVFGDELPGNPVAEVEVRAAPDGTILGRRLAKSSGVKEWDDAVLRAIDRTGSLPRDLDGRVPSPMVIAIRPRE